jgi:hypothetical protein
VWSPSSQPNLQPESADLVFDFTRSGTRLRTKRLTGADASRSEEAFTVNLELQAPWWARCEYNQANSSNAHVTFMMVKWTVTYCSFSYLHMSFHDTFVLTVIVLVTTLPLLVPWGTGSDGEGQVCGWHTRSAALFGPLSSNRAGLTEEGEVWSNPQDSFTPLYGVVSVIIPTMIVIQNRCMECLRRMQFIHIHLLQENSVIDDVLVHDMAPRRLSKRTSTAEGDQQLFVEQFATLTVLNCRLSPSDIERITNEEGHLVCLETLRRLIDVFDRLVRQHDCHKVMRSRPYSVAKLRIGWEITPRRRSRRPPISLFTIAAPSRIAVSRGEGVRECQGCTAPGLWVVLRMNGSPPPAAASDVRQRACVLLRRRSTSTTPTAWCRSR